MNKFIAFIVALSFSVALAATNKPSNSKVGHYKLFEDADQVLDSGETATATDVWALGLMDRNAATNILGTYGGTCKDSTGSDSLDVYLMVDVNYSMSNIGQPAGTWTVIDSVLIDSDDGASTEDVGTFQSANDPLFIRFRLENAGDHVDEKATCTDLWWNPRAPNAEKVVR